MYPSSTTNLEIENRQFNKYTQNNGSGASDDEFDVFASPENFSSLEPFDRFSRRLDPEPDRLPAHDPSLVSNNVPRSTHPSALNSSIAIPRNWLVAGSAVRNGQASATFR